RWPIQIDSPSFLQRCINAHPGDGTNDWERIEPFSSHSWRADWPALSHSGRGERIAPSFRRSLCKLHPTYKTADSFCVLMRTMQTKLLLVVVQREAFFCAEVHSAFRMVA